MRSEVAVCRNSLSTFRQNVSIQIVLCLANLGVAEVKLRLDSPFHEVVKLETTVIGQSATRLVVPTVMIHSATGSLASRPLEYFSLNHAGSNGSLARVGISDLVGVADDGEIVSCGTR